MNEAARTRQAASHTPAAERAALIRLVTRATRGDDPDLPLDELAGLAEAAGAVPVLRATQDRSAPDPATLIGRGKAEALATACDSVGATLAIFDNDLTPAQARNLEQLLRRRVVDRTEADPRHLRAARAHPGRQAAGRAGAAANI